MRWRSESDGSKSRATGYKVFRCYVTLTVGMEGFARF